MTDQLLVIKQDLVNLQQRGFFKSLAEVDSIWNELKVRCPSVSSSASYQEQKCLDIPSLQGNLKPKELVNDLCIAYAKNGTAVAKQIQKKLQQKNLKVVLATDDDQSDVSSIEKRVADSMFLVVLLTEKSLQELDVVFAMTAGKFYFKHLSQILLVHDAGSCFFPGYNEQPPSLLQVFSEKAITFLSCYTDQGIQQIVEKIESEKQVLQNVDVAGPGAVFSQLLRSASTSEEIPIDQFKNILAGTVTNEKELDDLIQELDKNGDGKIDLMEFSDMLSKSSKFSSLFQSNDSPTEETEEDISTTLFLSHKRSTGQGIAGRLYEGLKGFYKVFLDSEAKFKIHNLQKIVEQTAHFIFILSPGILLSKWCLEELKSAVANNKKITIVRELGFQLPDNLPSEWAPFETLLRSPDQLLWLAEYNQACVDAIQLITGPPDASLRALSPQLPAVTTLLEKTGSLAISVSVSIPAFFHMTQNKKELWDKITEISAEWTKLSKIDANFLKEVQLQNLTSIKLSSLSNLPILEPSKIKKLCISEPLNTRFENLEELRLGLWRHSGDIHPILKYCGSSLRSLEILTDSPELKDWNSFQQQLPTAFPNLERFKLVVQSNFMPSFHTTFPKVTQLDLDYKMDASILKSIKQNFPNITTLRLGAGAQGALKLADMVATANHVFEKVLSLELSFAIFSSSDIKALVTAFPNVESFQPLSHKISEDAELFSELSKCQNFRHINLQRAELSPQSLLSLLPVVARPQSPNSSWRIRGANCYTRKRGAQKSPC